MVTFRVAGCITGDQVEHSGLGACRVPRVCERDSAACLQVLKGVHENVSSSAAALMIRKSYPRKSPLLSLSFHPIEHHSQGSRQRTSVAALFLS